MIKTRLKFKCVSEIIGSEDICLMVLADEAMMRQITIVCDKATGLQVDLRVRKLPVTKIMIPEVLSKFLGIHSDLKLEIVIQDIKDGQYLAYLCGSELLGPVPIRASDAVLLSIAGNVPLYIDSSLMARQSVPYRENAAGISIPVNTLSYDMLLSALDNAIECENYELASHLNDEIKRRKKNVSDDKKGDGNEGD